MKKLRKYKNIIILVNWQITTQSIVYNIGCFNIFIVIQSF